MGNKSKCLRCGYEIKNLAVVDENAEKNDTEQEKIETKVIDPCNVFLTHPYGYEDDYGTGFGPMGDPFASLFGDLFGDPISDLLGGLFGFDVIRPRRQTYREEEPPKKKRKQGPVVVIDDIELFDANDEPIESDKHERQKTDNAENKNHAENKHSAKPHKNPFRKKGRR